MHLVPRTYSRMPEGRCPVLEGTWRSVWVSHAAVIANQLVRGTPSGVHPPWVRPSGDPGGVLDNSRRSEQRADLRKPPHNPPHPGRGARTVTAQNPIQNPSTQPASRFAKQPHNPANLMFILRNVIWRCTLGRSLPGPRPGSVGFWAGYRGCRMPSTPGYCPAPRSGCVPLGTPCWATITIPPIRCPHWGTSSARDSASHPRSGCIPPGDPGGVLDNSRRSEQRADLRKPPHKPPYPGRGARTSECVNEFYLP